MTGPSPDRPMAPVGPPILRPGPAALSKGRVWHRRNRPVVHRFTYDVQQVWIDPDRPQELFDRHRLWSHRRPAPIRYRASDYFLGDDEPIGPRVRAMVAESVGHEPAGPVRMLTQPRTWGWLFNPITVHLIWDTRHETAPIGALLEVTNTPWKERHHYPLPLTAGDGCLWAEFDKILHVSPFLDEDMTYRFTIRHSGYGDSGDGDLNDRDLNDSADRGDGTATSFTIAIDAFAADDPASGPVVETAVDVVRPTPTPAALRAAVRTPIPTHRVSAGIHTQAARLWRRGVPFLKHPGRAATRPEDQPTAADPERPS